MIDGERDRFVGGAAGKQFRAPGRSERMVSRTDLVDRLAGTPCQVVVLTAPAGYGKSTVLSQWAEQDTRPFVWLSLVDSDNNPRRLRQRITAAVATLRFSGAEMPPLTVLGHQGLPERLRLEDLLDQVGTPCVIVLDDAHQLRAPGALAVVDTLMSHLPAGSQLAAAGRHAAPLGVRKWRSAYQVLELGPLDLAFTPRESRIAVGPDMDATGARATHVWSEGWPALVSLAAAAAGSAASPATSGLPVQAQEFVAQYLESEVLSDLTDTELHFLTRTSILEELTIGACDAVTGESAAEYNLQVMQSGLLTAVGEPAAGRFRYHRLLRQSLLTELESREPGIAARLHGCAARWFAGLDETDAALQHAVLADDMDYLGHLVWPLVRPALDGEELTRLQNWLKVLSRNQISRSAELVLASAWASLLAGDLSAAARWLALAQARESENWRADIGTVERLGALALLLAWVCRGGVTQALELSSAAFEGLAPDSPWRASAGALSGMAMGLSGRTSAAGDRLRVSADLADALDDQGTRADCLAALVALDCEHCSRLEGDRHLEQVRASLATDDAPNRPTSMFTSSVLAEFLARVASPAIAGRALDQARATTASMSGLVPWLRAHSMVKQVKAYVLLGNVTQARQLLREVRPLVTGEDSDSLAALVAAAESTLDSLPADPAMGFAPFTAAERRILHLLPTYLSFVEMGALLSVSRHTVKTQALAVYRKLGAVSRHQAVERATAVGFFDPIAVPDWAGA